MRKTVGTILFLATILGILSPLALFGLTYSGMARITAIQTSAMEPTIADGSLALSFRTPTSTIKPGQIISSRTIDGTNGDTLGRVETIQSEPSSKVFSYTLKSDANPLVDEWVYKTNTDSYKVVFTTPYAGDVVTFLQTVSGSVIYFTLILILAYLYIYRLHSPATFQTRELKKVRKQETYESEHAGYGGIEELSSWFDMAGSRK